MTAEPGWPLSGHHEELVRDLARFIALGGAWRFARGPVIAARASSFPEPWRESRDALGTLVGRVAWHAHLDLEIAIDDARAPRAYQRTLLRDTKLALVHADAGRVELVLTELGNDDVAGIVSHVIGHAFATMGPSDDHPFRHAETGEVSTALGSLATIYLGLGVLAANAALHDRSAGETLGSRAYSTHKIAQAGGLPWQDLAFLLAVQATVRDDVLDALGTLHESQAKHVAEWRRVLDDHEAELAAMLALGDVAAEAPPARPAEPRAATVRAELAESDLQRANVGRRVFRMPGGSRAGQFGMLGLVAALPVAMAVLGPSLLGIGIAMAPGVVGSIVGHRRKLFRCASCNAIVGRDATECRACGGMIAGEVRSAIDRLDAEDELDRE